MATLRHRAAYLLYPFALPVFLLLLYYSRRRDPKQWLSWAGRFLLRAFLAVQAVWIGFGLLTITLDQNTRPKTLVGSERCFPDTAVCTFPNQRDYGPLDWTLLHAPLIPLGLFVEATEEIGMERLSGEVEQTARDFNGFQSFGHFKVLLFVKLGFYLYLALLFLPATLVIWLVSLIGG